MMQVQHISMRLPLHLIPVLMILMLSVIESISSLQCFQCGLYVPPEGVHLAPGTAPGKIFPCTNLSISHLKDCKENEKSCMKYSNAGLEVRLCSENCIEDVNGYSEREIHCCNDDACNESPSLNLPTLISLITLLLVACFML